MLGNIFRGWAHFSQSRSSSTHNAIFLAWFLNPSFPGKSGICGVAE
ncbi:unnamed protein product [Rhodiola kirilowii]